MAGAGGVLRERGPNGKIFIISSLNSIFYFQVIGFAVGSAVAGLLIAFQYAMALSKQEVIAFPPQYLPFPFRSSVF